MNAGTKAILITAAILAVVYVFVPSDEPSRQSIPSHAETETYRLIVAHGNDETEIARDLSESECKTRRDEYKSVSETMGLTNDALGIGSVTCLPESVFED